MKFSAVTSNKSQVIKFINVLELNHIILPCNCPNSIVVVMHQVLSLPLAPQLKHGFPWVLPQDQAELNLASRHLAPAYGYCPPHMLVSDGVPDNVS